MDIKEFAELLNGREYGHPQFTKKELKIAKENDFLIICGASDDLMEIYGAFEDEADVYDGGVVHIQLPYESSGQMIGGGVVSGNNGQNNVFSVNAKWCEDRDENERIISWTYETTVPHETFDLVENGEIYCRGIVMKI